MKNRTSHGESEDLSIPDCVFFSILFKKVFQQMLSKKFYYIFALEA